MLDEGRIKALTGSAKTNARDLYQSNAPFDNTVKIWFDLNTLPKFSGVDDGIARRPKVIPFDWRVPAELKDKKLPEKLRAEAKGILAWIVSGAVAWNKAGSLCRPRWSTPRGSTLMSRTTCPRSSATATTWTRPASSRAATSKRSTPAGA
jgi:phage/plasmid-associated DNA primase